MTKQLSDLDFSSVAKIQNLPQATTTGQPVTYEQWQAQIEGLSWKDEAKAWSTANVNLSSPGSAIDGVSMASGDRFGVSGQTTASENGVYIWNGAAVAATRALDLNSSAEFNSAVVPVMPGGTANGGTTWRCSTANPTVGTTTITFVSFSASAPAATESLSGVAEIATQAETDTGTDDQRFVTPLKLANYTAKKLKKVQAIGDGSATQIDVTHNFNTRDLAVQVQRVASPYDIVNCDISLTSVNAVRLNFASAPTSGQYQVVILG